MHGHRRRSTASPVRRTSRAATSFAVREPLDRAADRERRLTAGARPPFEPSTPSGCILPAELSGRSETWVTPTFSFRSGRDLATCAARRRIVSRDFVGALLQLNAEKQVPREQLVRAVEEGIQSAYRRVAGDEDIHVRIEAGDRARSGSSARARVVDEIEDPADRVHRRRGPQAQGRRQASATSSRPSSSTATYFGRIGAQTAKQIVLQRIREVERDQVFDQFASREGELITGTRQPGRAARDHPRRRQGRRGDPRHHRAEPARALPHRPERQGVRPRGPPLHARAADLRQPHPQGLPAPPVRARGARRSTPGRSRSRRSPARPAAARRSPSRRARRGSTRSARRSASAARASRPSSPSSAARRST